jgi:hypothetical protein
MDHRRFDLPIFFQPIGFAPPAQSKHFPRHHVISLVSSAIRRGERSCSLFLQRFRRDGVVGCNTHAGGRALSIAIRGFRLRDLVINHQFCDYGCRSRRLIYLRPCVHQEPCPTHPGVRHLYSVCICSSPPPASRRNTGSQYLLAIPASQLTDFDNVIMSGRQVARHQRRKSHIGRSRVPFGRKGPGASLYR